MPQITDAGLRARALADQATAAALEADWPRAAELNQKLVEASPEDVEARNRLEQTESGTIRAVATDERETIPCGLVFRSVGYRGVALPDVPFDESRGTMRNEGGRVLDESGKPLEGVYCAGWIKRGPTGVIGTNKKDATETVELLLEDLRDAPRVARTDADVDAFLVERGAHPVIYSGWAAIDERERGAGEPLGRPRVKLCTWDELLDAAETVAAKPS